MKKRGEAKCTETACDIKIRPVCCVKWNKLSKPAQIRQVDSPFWAEAQAGTQRMWDVKLSPLDIGFLKRGGVGRLTRHMID